MLVYSTPVLDRPIEVTGPIELRLFVASSARDTDFTGKLVDVYPDGRALILTEGILRARYRTSFTAPELLEPDAIYEGGFEQQLPAIQPQQQHGRRDRERSC